MRLPKRVKVGGITYRIIMVNEESLESHSLADTVKGKQLIRVSDDLLKNVEIQVLFHELFHAHNWEMSEEQVETLSQQVVQLMLDNPSLPELFRRSKRAKKKARPQ